MQSTANRKPQTANSSSGLLLIDKPTGWTSHDVVNKVRGIYGLRRVGHAGTLDPLATGLLIVLVGQATKLSDQLLGQDKTYAADIKFGQQTDTGDADGRVIDSDDTSWLTGQEIVKILPLLLGTREQLAPAYSAIKMNGRKLYDLARSGQPVQRPSRTITISSLELNNFDQDSQTAQITIHCSKGTYIRVLAEEIAEKLGTVAHLSALRRLSSGQFTIEQAVTLEELTKREKPEQYLRQI